MTTEIVCKNCRYGVFFDDGVEYASVDCHYEPMDITHTPDWWCGKFEKEEAVTEELSHKYQEMAFPEAADRAREGYVMVRQDCWNEDGYHTISYADVNAQDWTYLTEKDAPIRDKKWGEPDE
jgi:hypothetical protein